MEKAMAVQRSRRDYPRDRELEAQPDAGRCRHNETGRNDQGNAVDHRRHVHLELINNQEAGEQNGKYATNPRGNRRILFKAADRKRRTIRLGKASRKTTEDVARKVEALNSSIILQQPLDDCVAKWVGNLDSELHDKLAAVGLVRHRGMMTLKPFLDDYISKRSDVKKSTAAVYGHTRRCLIELFGA